jgi:WD40 repeat protein
MIENIIPNVHSSYITGLVELNNERLLTSCRKELLMKIFQDDDLGSGYKEKIQKKGPCGCLLYFEDKNKVLSGDINGIISIYEEKEPKAKPNEYLKTQTLQNHDGPINTLSKLSDKQFISGGVDGRVVIWEEQDNIFLPIDSIKMDRPIIVVLGLFDSRIAFSCDDKKIYLYKINDSFVNIQKELCKYIEDEILIKHKGRVSCLSQLNNSYIVSGGTERID